MSKPLLFLVDRQGVVLPSELRLAVEAAHRWSLREYPQLDPSLLDTWAEQVGLSMSDRDRLTAPRRYAFSALKKRIQEHYRSGGLQEVSLGIREELEVDAGFELQTAKRLELGVLLEELRVQLNERDRRIFILLQQDITSPESIGSALGISYSAAGKAVQRVRERLRAMIAGKPVPTAKEDHDEQA